MYKFLFQHRITILFLCVTAELLLFAGIYNDFIVENRACFYLEGVVFIIILLIASSFSDNINLHMYLNCNKKYLEENISPSNYIFYDFNRSKVIIPDSSLSSLGIKKKYKYELDDLKKLFSKADWQEIDYFIQNRKSLKAVDHKGVITVKYRNDKERHFRYRIQNLKDNNNNLDGLICWFVDFTSSYNHESNIVSLIKKYRLMSFELDYLFNHLPIGLWRREGDGEIVFSNTNFKKIANNFVDKDGVSELESGLRRLSELTYIDSKPATIVRNISLNNMVKSFEFTELPISKIGGSVGYAIDVSEREELLKNMRSLSKTLEEIMDLSSHAILIMNKKLEIVKYNLNVVKLFDIDRVWLTDDPNFSSFWDKLYEMHKLPDFKDYKKYKSDLINSIRNLAETKNDFLHLPDGKTIKFSLIPSGKNTTVIFENITDVLGLERLYNEAINVHESMLKNIPSAVLIFGPDGKLRFFNDRFIKDFWGDKTKLASDEHFDKVLNGVKILKKSKDVLHKQIVQCIESRESSQKGITISKNVNAASTLISLPDNTSMVIIQKLGNC